MLQSPNIHDRKLTEEISNAEEHCGICLKYKKPKLRPIVGFSLSTDFNDVVAVNLKPIEKVHILLMLTQFSAAAVVKSKKKRKNYRSSYKKLDCHF